MLCPRRSELGDTSMFRLPAEDDYAAERCTYCGSMPPDLLMNFIERGLVTLEPTDKNYKIYVHADDGKWRKFYFQHLSVDQRKRFVELVNEKKIKLSYPGHFYVPPFFMSRI